MKNAATPPAGQAPGRYWVLFAVCAAGLILPLEYTGPAMALPAIEAELGGGAIALSWVINAFALSFGSAVMAAGALADQVGRKRMFIIGLSAFALSSVLVSFSPNVIFLDVVRVVQGIAAALAMAGGAASLAQVFFGHARTRAFSLLGTAFGVGLAFGPVISGSLIAGFGWRAIFMLGALVSALALLCGARYMKESTDPNATRLDYPGIVSFTLFLAALSFAIMYLPQAGGLDLTLTLIVLLCLGALIFFIRHELAHPRPMLDLSLFKYKRFVGVQFLPIATAACFITLLIILPIRLIGIDGFSEAQAGGIMLALSAPMLFVPLLAGILARWLPATLLSCGGLLLAAAGLGWLATLSATAPPAALTIPLLMIGTGAALPWGLMDDLSISVVPIERAGMATGIFTTMRACGEAVCIAAALALLNVFIFHSLSAYQHLPWETLRSASNALTTGNPDSARLLLSNVPDDAISTIYHHAFSKLALLLMVVTLVSAGISMVTLRKSERSPVRAQEAKPIAERDDGA